MGGGPSSISHAATSRSGDRFGHERGKTEGAALSAVTLSGTSPG